MSNATDTIQPAPQAPVRDLREAIALLKAHEGQFVSTDVEVDPDDIPVIVGVLASRKRVAVLLGADPETGKHDVTIHRLCVQGRDEKLGVHADGPPYRRHVREVRRAGPAHADHDLHAHLPRRVLGDLFRAAVDAVRLR